MKKIIYAMIGILIFSLFLFGCKKEETGPEDKFSDYIDLWNEQKFEQMYDMLASSVKNEISKEEFTDRYKKIYGDLGVSNLKVEFNEPENTEPEEGTITFPFSVSMETVAGPIQFEQEAELIEEERDEEKDWYINWNTGFIFAGMDWGDKVGLKMIPAVRGEIVDRNGKGLAVNGEVNEAGLIPGQMEGQEQKIMEQVSELLGISVESIENALNASWVQPDFYVPIKKFTSDDEDLKTELAQITGVQIRTAAARVYPLKEAAAHLIGYVGNVTAEDLEKHQGYSSNDVIGKRGLEELFEKRLKGENGVEITLNKPDGSEVLVAEKPVKNGENIQLTIDSELQQIIHEKFAGKAGTAAAMHPVTGETLALSSSPSFDPNDFVLGISNTQYSELEEDPLKPLVNRFVLPHTPGSVMKPFTAAIAMESGTAEPETALDIKGKSWQKDDSWGGYRVVRVTDPGRPVNMRDALVFSDNIYFAQTALKMGEKTFIEGLQNFGFNEEIPFTYPLQQSNISNSGKLDNDILLADSGYGQGEVQTNIIQLISGFTPFINDGSMIKPILLKEEEPSQVWRENVISQETAKFIAESLREVVSSPSGTGHLAEISGLPLAGKTGTAEIAKTGQGEKGVENGWFVAWHYDTEDLLVGITMEGIQEEGSKIVVQKAKEIFDEWNR